MKGCIIDNVQWVHKNVNKLKTDMNQCEFLKWADLISTHQNKS